ncbi:MBL fold metallo-hydrolase [bacterium]|nr:MBL fold metallo-hydrolase [bacterium]
MRPRLVLSTACLAVVAALAWLTHARPQPAAGGWEEVVPGVFRTTAAPHGYAVVDGKRAVLIDATTPPDALKALHVESIDAVLLTHHHRDTAAFAAAYRKAGVAVRTSKEAGEWLTPEGVAKAWKDAVPLRNSRTGYFVLPEAVPGVDCTLEPGKGIALGPWTVTPVATPGHSRDHLAFQLTKADGTNVICCGDAFHTPGKLWSPYTTDWDHWTDAGLTPAAASLRALAKLDPTHLLPAHGPVLAKECAKALTDTAAAVEEAAFLKSFERFSKREGNPPQYPFLVPKEQIGSGGDKPWAKVSDHLWITGNTYVLKARDGAGCLVLDPWAERIAAQIEKLRGAEKLGPVEVVAFSHAHYDHFDGLYYMAGRDRVQVWALDTVAGPLKEPFRWRAPFLDERPIRFTKELKDGETAAWGGYEFKFHHLPGQTWFTAAIEATIDGKRGLFTADNFFHQDQYSGSGGWMGLNRSSPAVYGTSARKVLDLAPEWVLAEHGGPYVFNAEDYRRRERWGAAAAKACDALSPSGSHLRDWTPHRVSVEPVRLTAKAGDLVRVTAFVDGLGPREDAGTLTLHGRGVFPSQTEQFRVGPSRRNTTQWTLTVPWGTPAGRHPFAVSLTESSGAEPVDAFVVIDVTAP